MKELIDRIMMIDRTAQERLTKAQEQKAQRLKQIQEQKIAIAAEMDAHAKERLADADKIELEIAEEKVAEIKKRVSAEKARLDEVYHAQKESYLNTILTGIIPLP